MARPVCGHSGADVEQGVQVSVRTVAGALSDRYQLGQGTRGPTGEFRQVNRVNGLKDASLCAC